MSTEKKDTIYIDVDDEITSIIEKVRSSPQKIVALVLPKRATVLQSIVNMKLLKRNADNAKKKLVLITSEAGLAPIAGAVGLHVASTLQSKPAIPPPPVDPTHSEPVGEVNMADGQNLDPNKPVGELAGLPPAEEETINVDDEPTPDEKAAEGAAPAKKSSKGFKIPNFNKFRMRLILGIAGLLLLLIGFYVANFVLPRAEIIVRTDTQNISSEFAFMANPNIETIDEEENMVPSTNRELKKSDSQKAPATGQKNVGEKATGTVRIYNCNQIDKLADNNRTVPAGTAVSSGNFNFILSESVEVKPSKYIGNICQEDEKSDPVEVVAQNPGSSYNLDARDYSVSGFSSMTAEGSDMTGGTDEIVKVVSEDDIDKLRQKIINSFTADAKQELSQLLESESLIPLEDTFQVGDPIVVSSPDADDEADEITVNVTMNFSMLGVEEANMNKLIEKSLDEQVDFNQQQIVDNGLKDALFKIERQRDGGVVDYSLETVATLGPRLDGQTLRDEITNKKRGEVENIIKNRPGVKETEINLSPFWVSKTPRNVEKINVIIENLGQDQEQDQEEDQGQAEDNDENG